MKRKKSQRSLIISYQLAGEKMDVKISVIVSMYNIEEFVEECVKSLVNQTLKDIEIILVNDGSSDGTYDIAQRFSNLYSHVQVINKANGGLSSARNAGLSKAKGEYVAFVDGDDYVLPNMFEIMYENARKNNADMVMVGYMRLLEDGTLNFDREMTEQKIFTHKKVIQGKSEIQNDVLAPMIGVLPESDNDIELNSCVWRNLYRKEVLDQCGVKFKSEREYISEDMMFHLELLPHLNIISTICKPAYIYRFNRNSLTKRYRPERFQKECFLYQSLLSKVSELNIKDIDLRLKRSFIGRVRNCILSEIYANKNEDFWQRKQNIKKMLQNEMVASILQQYPIHQLNLKLRIYTHLMKYNNAIGLIILGLLYKRRYVRK